MKTNIQKKLQEKINLTQQEAGKMLEMLLSSEITDEKKGEMLRQLSQKGETVEEIVGFITGMRKRMITIDFQGMAVDTCGTGGDGKGTLNISTATALVVAGSGVAVAKHGNRSSTSKSGSADVLEALGVNVLMDKDVAHRALHEVGLTFLFAPLFHPAMKVLGPIRKNLGVPTIFNMLGPFLNPAGVQHQLIGVPTIAKAQKLIEVGKMLGYKQLFIVSSHDGLDEVSIAAPTTVFSLQNGSVDRFEIDPKEFGLQGLIDEIIGGDPSLNAQHLRELIEGKESAYANAVVLNSAVAMLVAGSVATIKDGIKKAQVSIKEGKAKNKLEELVKISHI